MIREFAEAQSPETFCCPSIEAGSPSSEGVGGGGLNPDDANTGIGVWLPFAKEAGDGR